MLHLAPLVSPRGGVKSYACRRTAVRGKNTLLQGVLWILRMDGAK